MTTILPLIRCWKFEEWPHADRAAWSHGCSPSGLFEPAHPAALWRVDSLTAVAKSYGRWLSFLSRTDGIDPDVPALERVTPARLADYLREMRAAGNADATIIGRINHLAMALTVMAPDADVSWIRKPGGVTIYRLLPNRRRPLRAPDSDVLFDWAVSLMDAAQTAGTGPDALHQFRDGLLLAMLAARGRRLRSMSVIRVGQELVCADRRYRVDLTRDQVKTDTADSFGLPDELRSYIDHYLAVVRPALLGGRQETALWVKINGEPLAAAGIQIMVRRRTLARFGEAYGPHRFRHAIVTTAALRVPEYPDLGAQVLGISSAVARQHYCLDRTNAVAVSKLGKLIGDKRRAAGISLGLPAISGGGGPRT